MEELIKGLFKKADEGEIIILVQSELSEEDLGFLTLFLSSTIINLKEFIFDDTNIDEEVIEKLIEIYNIDNSFSISFYKKDKTKKKEKVK